EATLRSYSLNCRPSPSRRARSIRPLATVSEGTDRLPPPDRDDLDRIRLERLTHDQRSPLPQCVASFSATRKRPAIAASTFRATEGTSLSRDEKLRASRTRSSMSVSASTVAERGP